MRTPYLVLPDVMPFPEGTGGATAAPSLESPGADFLRGVAEPHREHVCYRGVGAGDGHPGAGESSEGGEDASKLHFLVLVVRVKELW